MNTLPIYAPSVPCIVGFWIFVLILASNGSVLISVSDSKTHDNVAKPSSSRFRQETRASSIFIALLTYNIAFKDKGIVFELQQ